MTHLQIPPVSEENICLPLAVSAVSGYWGVDLPISEAREIAKKYAAVKASILIEGIELAQKHGLQTLILRSSLGELKKFLGLEIPPIVILPGLYDVVQHASVISGYDQSEGAFIHYMPQPDKIGLIPQRQFDQMWEEDGRLALLIAPNEVISTIPVNENATKSNRLCFESERLNLLGRQDEAISALNEAISLDQGNFAALCLLAGIYNEKNSQECVQLYQKCIHLNKKCYLAFRGLGNYYLKTKQYEKAESYYSEAIKINEKRYGPIYKNRAIAKMELNKYNDAKQDLKNYLKYTPNAKDRDSILQAIKDM